MSKRKATSNTRPAKEALTMEQLRVRHTEMLNASFFRWIQDQHANHRAEFWRNGLEEYLQYGQNIQDRFPIALDSQAAELRSHVSTDLAAPPKAKLSRLAPLKTDNGKPKSSAFQASAFPANGFNSSLNAWEPVTTSDGTSTVSGSAAASSPLASTTGKPPTFNFGSGPAPAPGPSGTDTAPEPKVDLGQQLWSSTLAPSQGTVPLTTRSANEVPFGSVNDVAFGSPSAFPLLNAEPKAAFQASISQDLVGAAATISAPSLFGAIPSPAFTSLPLPSTSSHLAQPGSQTQPAVFGTAQTQPAFGSSIFPASSSLPPFSSSSSQPGSAATPPFSLAPSSTSGQQPGIDGSAIFSFPPGPSQLPTSGSESAAASMPTFTLGSSQPASLPAFSFGSSQIASAPAFNMGSSQTTSNTAASSSSPSTAPAPFQPSTLSFGPSAAPSFGAGFPAPVAFGSSVGQPAASTSDTNATDAQPSSTGAFLFNSLPAASFSAPSAAAPFSFTWAAPPASSSSTGQSTLGATNGPASLGGFSFGAPASTSFATGGLAGQNGTAALQSANGRPVQEEEEQQEAEAPTEYIQDEGVVVSQDVQWRHKKGEAWDKPAKGRVLARKSGKGSVYLQFVTSSGQVVSTATIAGELKQHQASPARLVGMLHVSARHMSKEGMETFDDPTPKLTMMTCNSEALAKDFVTKVSEAKAAPPA